MAHGKTRRAALAAGLACAGLLVGCRAGWVAPDPAAVDASRPAKTFLWTVTSPTATVHLLGSIHVASPDLYPLDPRIEAAFERSSVLVLELPVHPEARRAAAEQLRVAGTYPAGETLDAHLDPVLLERLQEHLRARAVPFAAARGLRPWLLATSILFDEMQRQGYHPALGIDRYFAARAAADRKRVLALETIAEQVALLAGMSERAQEAMLRDALAGLDRLGEVLGEAVRRWRAGDADGVERLLIAPTRAQSPEVYQRLFAERNARMTAALEGYLRAAGERFVVVGCGHLVGQGGILDRLRVQGYRPVQQ
jgi:uncharacterized protein YbaP (TraB family)